MDISITRILIVLLLFAAGGCTNNTQSGCTPGKQVACACPGSTVSGTQQCLPGGIFGPCMGCPAKVDMGGGDGGADMAHSGDGGTRDFAISSDDGPAGSVDLAANDEGEDQAIPDLPMDAFGTTDSAVIDLSPVDLATVACGLTRCAPGLICCLVPDTNGRTPICMTSADCAGDGGGYPGMCSGPADCPQSMPPTGGCCVSTGSVPAPDGGTLPMSNSECMDPCPGYFSVDVTNTAQVNGIESQLCHTGADCAGYMGAYHYSLFGIPGNGSTAFDHCCTSFAGPAGRVCTPYSLFQMFGLAALLTCF